MSNDDFTNQEGLISSIKEFLNKGGIEYTDDNPDPKNVNFQFKFEDLATKLNIIIGQTKDQLYRIDVVSVVNFSQEHVEALNKTSPNEKQLMLDDVFFWLSPRDPDFLINLNPKEENQIPHYLVIMPIFEGDLSLGNLMRTIRLVVKSSAIARRRIQLYLSKFMQTETVEESEKDEK